MTTRAFGEVVDENGQPIAIGTIFENRAAVAEAGMHTPVQAGIAGSETEGAESIVVSGGYEDDEDHGDVIVYTGQGGQDDKTKKQIKDQIFKRGNQALVVSCNEGRPVRVVRGAHRGSPHAPIFGYRYDGLFRVEDFWQEPGRAGFLMCRFRLVRWMGEASETSTPAPASLPPGNATPSRRSMTVQRVIRNSDIGTSVKRLYDYACQICGIRIESAAGPYAEAAHVRGLGRPHNGPDVPGNVLCLCPNHHVLLDLGAIFVNDDLSLGGLHTGALTVSSRHGLDLEHLRYHRARHEGMSRVVGDVT